MKLATLKNGTRDGQLLVVAHDLSVAADASVIAPNLLYAIEHWADAEPPLQELYRALNAGVVAAAFPLEVSRLHAPLPRTWQWLDASAFHSHGDLLEKVFGSTPLPQKRTVPLVYQGAGDDFLGPADDQKLPSEADGMDFEAEVAIVVDRVPMGTRATEAASHIKLVMILNDTSLRVRALQELRTGFGFGQCKPATSFGPVAVTVDELGPGGWRDGRVQLPIHVHWNGRHFGRPNCGAMGFSFEQLIEYNATTRNLSAGTVIGSGTVSNENFREVGSACIAERRGIELLDEGAPRTEYMKFGDTVRIEMFDSAGRTIFGAIDQRYVRASAV